jgi:hypothetical protein
MIGFRIALNRKLTIYRIQGISPRTAVLNLFSICIICDPHKHMSLDFEKSVQKHHSTFPDCRILLHIRIIEKATAEVATVAGITNGIGSSSDSGLGTVSQTA